MTDPLRLRVYDRIRELKAIGRLHRDHATRMRTSTTDPYLARDLLALAARDAREAARHWATVTEALGVESGERGDESDE